jgi:hypothetical protein
MGNTYGFAVRFVGGIVPDGKVWVVEGIFTADTPGRIEAEHSTE